MSAYDHNNIFARILRGEIPNDTVYENEHVLAFNDINPQAPIHILVIPKGSYTDIQDFGANAKAAEIVAFYEAISKIVEEKNLKGKGCRVITNTGLDAGQEVPHYHAHILGGERLGPMRAKES